MSATPIFPGAVKTPVCQIQNSDASSLITLMTAGSAGSKLESLCASSTDTSAVVVQLIATISAVDYVLGEVNIPIGSGTNGSAKAVDVLNVGDLPWLRNDGANPYLLLAPGAVLKIKAKTTVTSAKIIQFFGQGGDF